MRTSLVIVESPTKARTLKRYLGEGYLVESSVGHVRDLPAKASEIPAKHKKEPWARMGVDIERDFAPLYVIQPAKKKTITNLRKLVGQVDELLLATDEDREGEAISWHLVEVLKPKVPVKRLVFHEITKKAILESLEHPRDIDDDLVTAQETRRIIDRLFGYEVSPILWKKIAPRLSAGRVQSVSVRLLVEREEARMRFRPAPYWDLTADFRPESGAEFPARLTSLDGKRIAAGKDFDPDTGSLQRNGVVHLEAEDARKLRDDLQDRPFRVVSAEEKRFTRSPGPPFITSTLQQEGNRKLRFDAKRTMRAAQRLYENGLITYMRTDSVHLSDEAIRLARGVIEARYGREYLPDRRRTYRHKVKNAQEAHEAIRPAGDRVVPGDEVRSRLGPDAAKVYDLIVKRTLACQMRDAKGRRMTLKVAPEDTADAFTERGAVFTATGSVFDFAGFLRAYVQGSDDPEASLSERETILPPLRDGDGVEVVEMREDEHVTTPPARYTEASLVKELEESGIGRPSTYAAIIDTIQRRNYAFKKGTALVPTFTAFAVVRLMKEHFTDLIDVDFTAKMEDALDAISRGEAASLEYLHDFYFGNGLPGLRPLLERKVEEIDPRQICQIRIGETADAGAIVVRVGRYGPFLQAGESTAPVPETMCPDELTVEEAERRLAEAARGDTPLGEDPETGEPIFVKNGRYGPYVQRGPNGNGEGKKPKTASLLPHMSPDTLTFEQALALLSLPRELGTDPDGVEVVAHNGRYGPYVKRGDDTRSLAPEDDVLAITLERALELLSQKKRSGGFRRRAEPLKVFENVEELDGADLRVLDGRFGPYVTDGDVNASLPRGMATPTDLTLGEAVELIRAKRERGGGRRTRKRTSRAKSGARTPGKKGTARKKTAAKTKSKPRAKTKRKSSSKAA